MKKALIIGATILTFGMSQPVHAEGLPTKVSSDEIIDLKTVQERVITDPLKVWSVKFNTEIDPDTFHNANVYVIDEEKNRLKNTYASSKEGVNEGKVHVSGFGYKEGENYTLVVTEGVQSKSGESLSQGVKMNFSLSGDSSDSTEEKSIHEYSKKELEAWIDKDADIKRLKTYPIKNDYFNDDFEKTNSWLLQTGYDGKIQEMYIDVSRDFMDLYFNRDYRSIGDEWIKELRYHYKTGFNYNGKSYSAENLQEMFDVFVQETKDQKRVSESVFVTDVSTAYNMVDRWKTGNMVRGTQYIRYKSGTDLPEGVELNKWYERDIDIKMGNYSYGPEITWEHANYAFDQIFVLSPYEEVQK